MKAVQRTSRVLKAAGIVLIILSLVLGLYSLINTGASREALNQGMTRFNAEGRITDYFAFDRSFFQALSRSADNRSLPEEERLEAIDTDFKSWFGRMENTVRTGEKDIQAALAAWLEKQTPDSLGLAEMEELEESRELREIFEYIDGLGAPPKKGKVAALKAASTEPFFQEFYADFSAGQEDAGTWFEFMTAVRSMLEKSAAEGGNVRDVKAWMSSEFTPEAYSQALETVRSEEKKESTDSLSDMLLAVYKEKENGGTADFGAFLDSATKAVTAKYPNRDLGGDSAETILAMAIPELFREGSGFDGSLGATADKMAEIAKEDEHLITTEKQNEDGTTDVTSRAVSTMSALRKWETGYKQKILAEADNRKDIPIVGPFWKFVSLWFWMLLAGILLIILSIIVRKALSRYLLKHRKDAGIQEDPDVLLRVEHLKQYFRSGPAVTKAVDDISFFIKKGEVFGLVGESGCGKTTTGRTIINLYDPTEGNVYFNGLKISTTQAGLPVLKADLRQRYNALIQAARKNGDKNEARRLKAELKSKLNEAEQNALESSVEKSKCVEFYREKRLKELKEEYDRDMETLSGAEAEERTRRYETERKVAAKDNMMNRMQMIFQDPIASINPRMTVREIIAEGLIIRGIKDKEYINQKVYEMLELVGLVREHADRYPHEFSGGQRQRIGIARAIIMEPDLIIADEPISALDVSIQAQVINLLNDLRERMGLTIMFIAHNLSVVKYFSDRIAVMYFGHIVELATSDELFAHPLHPYTKSLLSAIPYPDPHYEKNRKRIEYVPAKAHDYSVDKPELREITPGHYIHCNEAEYQQYLKELEA